MQESVTAYFYRTTWNFFFRGAISVFLFKAVASVSLLFTASAKDATYEFYVISKAAALAVVAYVSVAV